MTYIYTFMLLLIGCITFAQDDNAMASSTAVAELSHEAVLHIDPSTIIYGLYYNTQYNFIVRYPLGILTPQGELPEQAGQWFLRPEASLVAWGSAQNGLRLTDVYTQLSQEEEHRNVTYKVLRNNWFVVSGYDQGEVYYQRTHLFDDTYASFKIQYPLSLRTPMDKVIEEISLSFTTCGDVPKGKLRRFCE